MNDQSTIQVDCTKWYRTETPNMADEELDPFQYRLYGHYKRVCGENGSCWESLDTTASKCKMSRDKVIQTRQWLHDNGWISLEQKAKGIYHVRIANRWAENYELFTSRNIDTSKPQLIESPVEISTDQQLPVEISTDQQLPVDISTGLSEKTVSPVEISTPTSRNIDTKKELYKKNNKYIAADAAPHTDSSSDSETQIETPSVVVEKEKPVRKTAKRKAHAAPTPDDEAPKLPTEHQQMFEKICQIVGWDWKTIGEKEKGQVAQTLGILKRADYTLDELNRFGREVWVKDWRWEKYKQYPTLSLLRSEIGKLRQTEQQKEELRTPTDGISWKKVFEEQKTKFAEYEWSPVT